MHDIISSCAEEAGRRHGWSRRRVATAAREYRRFVDLASAKPRCPWVPCHDVDEVWHVHIEVIGSDGSVVPPHDPTTAADHERRFAATLDEYRSRFGEVDPVWQVASECQVYAEEAEDGDDADYDSDEGDDEDSTDDSRTRGGGRSDRGSGGGGDGDDHGDVDDHGEEDDEDGESR